MSDVVIYGWSATASLLAHFVGPRYARNDERGKARNDDRPRRYAFRNCRWAFYVWGIAVLFIDCPVDDCFCGIYNKAFSGVVAVHNHILVGLHFSGAGAQTHLRNID